MKRATVLVTSTMTGYNSVGGRWCFSVVESSVISLSRNLRFDRPVFTTYSNIFTKPPPLRFFLAHLEAVELEGLKAPTQWQHMQPRLMLHWKLDDSESPQHRQFKSFLRGRRLPLQPQQQCGQSIGSPRWIRKIATSAMTPRNSRMPRQ